ncbi:MAG: hypothetical protein SH817_11860, partial [Leptospira sp.]|nr:hypothetical protein [Leptospira sp.]
MHSDKFSPAFARKPLSFHPQNKKARIFRHELLTLLTILIRQSIQSMGWPVGAQEASDLASTARLQLASVM